MFSRARTDSLRRPLLLCANQRRTIQQLFAHIFPTPTWLWPNLGSSIGVRLQSPALLRRFPKLILRAFCAPFFERRRSTDPLSHRLGFIQTTICSRDPTL